MHACTKEMYHSWFTQSAARPDVPPVDREEMSAPLTTRVSSVSLLLLLLSLTCVCIDAYKHVIVVHGLFDGPKEFETMSLFINKVGCVTSCKRV